MVGEMNYFLLLLVKSRQTTDRQTESDAYEPTVQFAQVGSKNCVLVTGFFRSQVLVAMVNMINFVSALKRLPVIGMRVVVFNVL